MIATLSKQDLELIDQSIHKLIDKIKEPIVQNEARRLISSGGKRLRPLFLIWSTSSSKELQEAAYVAAASLELLHTSSLIHDDIIDNSAYRRGVKTSLELFGRKKATSIGTALSLFSISQMVSLGYEDISSCLADTLENLCKGELKQLDERYDFDSDCNDYFNKISHKTASLFALPCKIGGIISGYDEDEIKKLYEIGFNIGCSFQILDDIKDITSSMEKTGKESNEDIKNGVITLPYLLLMERDPIFKETIQNLSSNSTTKNFDSVLKRLKNSDAIEESYKYSNTFLEKAKTNLSKLNSNENTDKFNQIIDWLLNLH